MGNKGYIGVDAGTVIGEMPTDGPWSSICYGNGVYVALNQLDGHLVYSNDGANWADSDILDIAPWLAICYGDGKFVASSYTMIARSEDGVTWEYSEFMGDGPIRAICYGDGKFCSVGDYISSYSTDCITWETSNLSFSFDSICYGNGQFVAGNSHDTVIAYSADGAQWKMMSNPISTATSVCYGEDKFVIVGVESLEAAYSENGKTWTTFNMPFRGNFMSVVYGNGRFVALGGTNKVAYSDDGITWNISSPLDTGYWKAICYDGTKFVAPAYDGTNMVYSYDGIIWTNEVELNVAKEIKGGYIGVNGVARKIKKIYLGVNGIAKEIYVAKKPLKIVSWASGTDEEIVAMVNAHYTGEINLHDYWSVGDSRTVSLSAMPATGVGESHVAQNVTMVLMNAGGKTLTDGGECAFIVGQKNGLAERGYINSSSTNVGGWKSCARRTWCNNTYRDSIPSTLKNIFKQHNNITANGTGSSAAASADYFALPSEKEVLGSNIVANSTAEGDLKQFDYYKTSGNRVKMSGDNGSAYNWFTRSPFNTASSYFCDIGSTGTSSGGVSASNNELIAPFGVI